MKKLFSLLSIFAIVLSCSSDETSTPVTPPPAPIVKYTITLSAGEGGTVSTTGGEYEAGQTVSVTATPQGEYVFTSWSDGNTDATRTITISSNSTLTANFEKRKYPLTVNFEGEGEVIEEIINSGRSTNYDSGTTVKLTAQAAAEWVFVGWEGAINGTSNPQQLLISEPKEVTAVFEKKKYPLTVNIEGEGEVLEEIVNTVRTTDYDSGTTVKLTAVPAEGWEFAGWTGAIESAELEIQILVSEAKEINAEFKEFESEFAKNLSGMYFEFLEEREYSTKRALKFSEGEFFMSYAREFVLPTNGNTIIRDEIEQGLLDGTYYYQNDCVIFSLKDNKGYLVENKPYLSEYNAAINIISDSKEELVFESINLNDNTTINRLILKYNSSNNTIEQTIITEGFDNIVRVYKLKSLIPYCDICEVFKSN